MKKILVVDDNRDIVKLIQNRLEKNGFEVDVAADASDALDKIAAGVPDLITLDIMMPGVIGDDDKYGASLCEALKKDEAYQEIPIIIVSALPPNASPLIKDMIKQADCYIKKPIDTNKLIEEIKRILK